MATATALPPLVCPICQTGCRDAAELARHAQQELERIDAPITAADAPEKAPGGAARRSTRHAAKRAREGARGGLAAPPKPADPIDELLAELHKSRAARESWLGGATLDSAVKLDYANVPLAAGEAPGEAVECPVCGKAIAELADYDRDAHVDRCLRLGEAPSRDEPQGELEEYEWAGQTRVRATALMGRAAQQAAGWQSAAVANDELDDFVNITDDVADGAAGGFGAGQAARPMYTERDLLRYMDPSDETVQAMLLTHGSDSWSAADIPRAPGIDVVSAAVAESPAVEDPLLDDDDPEDDASQPGGLQPLLAYRAVTRAMLSELPGRGRLVAEALLSRIRELRAHVRAAVLKKTGSSVPESKCLICLDGFDRAVVSRACWHVHCEECWLRSLANRRVCPQCQRITSPADLQRIYL